MNFEMPTHRLAEIGVIAMLLLFAAMDTLIWGDSGMLPM